jgi:hypothetical protein
MSIEFRKKIKELRMLRDALSEKVDDLVRDNVDLRIDKQRLTSELEKLKAKNKGLEKKNAKH